MSETYDLMVLGAGMSGVAAAHKCAAQGWRIAIVDSLPYGGTCALRGCDPKKILRRGAEVIDSARLMQGKGVDAANLSINWADLMKHKHGFTDPVPDNMESGLAESGVETLHGRARFVGERQLDIDGVRYDADRFLVATGARPRPLDFPGHEHLIDSTGFLDLAELPPRIVFVGGGFISFEFAHIVARAGAVPVIVNRSERPLKGFDPDLVGLLVERGSAAGIEVRCRTVVVGVEAKGRGYTVTVERDGVRESIEADLVVHGAGRVADLADLGLDVVGVQWGERGVEVGPHLQSTTNPAVWAAGDSADTPGMPLTPVAVIEAKVAASNMLKGTTTAPNYAGIPTAVFTIPELARVGMLEQEARAQGIDVTVRHTDTSGWYSNYRIGETTAAAKVLIDQSTDRIVGAHLLGPEYGELINTFGLAITLGLTTRQLKSTTAAYPTVGSDLGSML
ncbi:pyridine nucleotide-disulfide oxidoreductase [Nocardioides sp. Root122]|uniref:dihydrolipoyl dehydrogenase family protein n=1 Tax=Nocardioides TaxID=1839 RepID=UPI00070342AC|nr:MULTISPECIES: NAD(P)/FAD-dependent oxidoreductase [Nocardioides]KQV63395.1 pyridine nucleotide-disulfide oxidoreductase [Nocardioides sp. Root122]MCK9826054.1 NAD(P)/FAD-dependent oxidoreductase [Nocardioides cavernae]